MTRTTARAYDMTKRVEAVEGTRRRIGASALELFKERDFDAVSLNEIARRGSRLAPDGAQPLREQGRGVLPPASCSASRCGT